MNLGLMRSRRHHANGLAQSALSSGSSIAQALITQVTADSEQLDALVQELGISVAVYKLTRDHIGDVAAELERQAAARPDDQFVLGRASGMRQAAEILGRADV